MSFTIVNSGDFTADNRDGPAPQDWFYKLPSTITLPNGRWFFNTTVQLQLQVFLQTTFSNNNIRRNTEKFYNPTQSQIGRYAALTDGFVVFNDRLMYEKQLYQYQSPLFYLGNVQATAPIVLARTINSLADHSQNINSSQICIAMNNGAEVPPGSPTTSTGTGFLVQAGLCMTHFKGQEELVQIDQYNNNSDIISARIDLTDAGCPDSLQGVLWPGHGLQIVYNWGYNLATSTAVQLPVPVPIRGAAKFALPGQSCSNGFPEPNSNFCDLGTYSQFYDAATGESVAVQCKVEGS